MNGKGKWERGGKGRDEWKGETGGGGGGGGEGEMMGNLITVTKDALSHPHN